MSFERPTLPELVARIEADFVSRLELASALLRRAVIKVLSRVIAGAAHMMHGHLDYLSRQLFPDQADDAYLVRQAGLFGISKTAPDYAQAVVEFTGTNGTVIPAGTILVRADGVEYSTDADTTIASGVAEADVTAEEPGADGSVTVGVTFSFSSAVAGADSTSTVTEVIQDGSDLETTEALRIRLLERLSDPPHGGTDADHIAWAKETPGVTRAWVQRQGQGPGTVVVRFVRDDDPDPIPDAGEVAAVQAVLDEKAPAYATAIAFAPTAQSVAFTIEIVPNTAANRAAVQTSLEDLFLRESEPGGGMLLSAMQTAIGTTAGITDYTLTAPVADVTSTTNQLPRVGTITWV